PATGGVEDLQPGHAERPREEGPARVILVEFLPEDEGGLLEEILGDLEVAHVGEDVPPQGALRGQKMTEELLLVRPLSRHDDLYPVSATPGKRLQGDGGKRDTFIRSFWTDRPPA